MKAINDMKDFIIEFETEWLFNDASLKDCADIIKRGWKGWDHVTEEEIIAKYKDLTED